jgi:SAM-dependent methyltransferase
MTDRDACRACGGDADSTPLVLREMMFGTREAFSYHICSRCGSAWIERVPRDLARHYPRDYHSFVPPERSSALRRRLQGLRAAHALGSPNPLGALALRVWGSTDYLEWCRRMSIGRDDRILDVGCGGGHLLVRMGDAGFRRLTGIDPFLDGDAAPAPAVRLYRRDLAATGGEFDLVMLHHSLEHMVDPLAALRQVRRLLPRGGWTLVRLPVAGRFAGREYGRDWVQWDAPRHLFVPTVDGMERLATGAEFTLEEVRYDSTGFQFWGSELYRHDIPLSDREPHLAGAPGALFGPEQLRRFEAAAEELNRSGDGDQACFFLRAT